MELLLQTEAIELTIVGAEVNLAVEDSGIGEVIEAGDGVTARPQFLAGLSIEYVDGSVIRLRSTNGGIEFQPDIFPRLLSIVAAAVSDDEAVGDDWRIAAEHVA